MEKNHKYIYIYIFHKQYSTYADMLFKAGILLSTVIMA